MFRVATRILGSCDAAGAAAGSCQKELLELAMARKKNCLREITFKAQVTDVHRPLMSVSRICDRGNRVVFDSQGGYIELLTTGEKIHVRRDHNVYRLQVEVPEPGFAGQGTHHVTYL